MAKNQKGSILITVLIVFSCLIILSGAIGTSMVYESNNSVMQQKRMQAYYIAKAGANAASKWITEMEGSELTEFDALDFPVKSEQQNFGEGTFELEFNKEAEMLIVKSTGRVLARKESNGNDVYATDTVTLVLKKDEGGQGISQINAAVFGSDEIVLHTYAEVEGGIGTASIKSDAIIFKNKVSLTGNIYLPRSAALDVISSEEFYDRVVRYDTPPNYPTPVLPSFPEGLDNIGKINLANSQKKTINSSGYYKSITLSNSAELTIETNNKDIILRTEELEIGNSGAIKVTGSGKVAVYVDNNITLDNSSKVNADRDKNKFVIYYAGKNNNTLKMRNTSVLNGSIYLGEVDVDIANSGTIYGDIITSGKNVKISNSASAQVIYAPNATIDIKNSAEVEGAVIGKKVIMNNSSKVKLVSQFIEPSVPIEFEGSGNGKYKVAYWK